MMSEKILHEKITHPRLKNQIVGPFLMALHAECYNILNSCRLCYLYLVCNIPFTNSTVSFIKKTKENKLLRFWYFYFTEVNLWCSTYFH